MEKVENGLYVSVSYKGTLQNGEVFDSSEGRQPLEVHIGAGQLIKGFEAALMDMSLNEKKEFTLTPDEAYGEWDEDQIHHFARSAVPPEMDPQVGQTIGLTAQSGHQVPARISHVDEEKITVDLNHPLAGETLTFHIEVVGISPTPTQEPVGCGSGCGSGSDDHGCGSGGGCCSDEK